MKLKRRLVGLCIAGVMTTCFAAIAPVAEAGQYNWYQATSTGGSWVGGGNDAVGSGFLYSESPDWRTVDASVNGGAFEAVSGDYCSFYKTPDLNTPDPNAVGNNTGFSPPTDSGYQIFDGGASSDSGCQANGNVWGWWLNAATPGSNCPATCGMQHTVSFHDSGTTLMPWASSFGDPSLVLRSSYHLNGYTYNCGSQWGCGAGWKYLCAMLEDTTTTQWLEYCLNEWSTYGPGDDPTPDVFTSIGQTEPWRGFANVQTNIDSTSDRATISPGSATTQLGAGSIGTYTVWQALISGAKLQNAVNAVNNAIVSKLASGNGDIPVPYSTDPTKYALLGLEDGNEFWGGQTSLGGYSDQLQAFTTY